MYNRWMPMHYNSVLYHHGVKGMKWGKHLFSESPNVQPSGGGGGSAENDELNEALEKYKRGEITKEQLDAVYKKIQSLPYRLRHEPLDVLNSAAVKTIHATRNVKEAVTHPDETASKAIHKGRELVEKVKTRNSSRNTPSVPNKNAGKVSVGTKDQDSMKRTYIAEGRDRYRKNGMYRNMNLTDVYGPAKKTNGHIGRNGADLYKDLDVDDVHNGKNYRTREDDKSKHNDGRYSTRDRLREKVTGKADPDHLKKIYNDYVYKTDNRVANQQQAYSVGVEEQDIRKTAAKRTDKIEQEVYNRSLNGLIHRSKKKRW